jgi:hypothetical protein
MLTDLPNKILNALVTNITLYFMTNLRREPGALVLRPPLTAHAHVQVLSSSSSSSRLSRP